MIQAFPDQPSTIPGDTITLRIATDAPQFRIDFYRQGATLDLRFSTAWIDGTAFRGEDHRPSDDWGKDGMRPDGTPTSGWNGFLFSVPEDWLSGAYIAMLVEGDEGGNPRLPVLDASTADARTRKALFVVKNPVPGVRSQILYKLPLFTYQAYNTAGGNSIYQGVDVSLRRPGGGTGGTPWDHWNFDPFDDSSPRQVFAHWDAKLIAWLEENGYRVDYCTDWDVHQDNALGLLRPYAVVLSVGHDEYYSTKMRDSLEAYVAAGGNIAFLSGNTCWWRAEFSNTDPFLMFGQQRILHWSDAGVNRPEDSLTGVSWRNGGEDDQDRFPLGYTVQHANHWVFEGAGIADGDIIGQGDGLVGYECDGTPYDKGAPAPVSPGFALQDDTPSGFMILGTADLSVFGLHNGNGASTIGTYTAPGTVFAGATTDWPRVVASGDPRVARITRNVIDRLGGNPKGLATLASLGPVIACDGFFTPDDGFRHAIVATRDGGITEIFYHPQQGQGQALLTAQAGLRDVGGFWSDDDGYRHAITATDDGNVWEVFFHPSTGVGQALLGNIPGAVRVAGLYSADDQFRHAIVATNAGEVFELFFHPRFGQGQVLLGTFPGLVDIGAFYSPDDRFRHVLVGQSDGIVTEIYFNPGAGIQQAVIGQVAGLASVSAYYAADDAFFNRRVALATADGQLHEIRYHPHFGIMRVALFRERVRDLGSFFTPDDGYRHTILASLSGEVQELFFRP